MRRYSLLISFVICGLSIVIHGGVGIWKQPLFVYIFIFSNQFKFLIISLRMKKIERKLKNFMNKGNEHLEMTIHHIFLIILQMYRLKISQPNLWLILLITFILQYKTYNLLIFTPIPVKKLHKKREQNWK